MAVSLAADWAGTTNLGSSQVGEGASPFAAMASAAASDSFLDGSLPFSSLGPDGARPAAGCDSMCRLVEGYRLGMGMSLVKDLGWTGALMGGHGYCCSS